MLAGGVRYVAMCLNSFTRQPYCDLPECFAGWMAREAPSSGEVFEARTVQDKIDLASGTTDQHPRNHGPGGAAGRLGRHCSQEPGWINNMHANRDNIARLARAIVGLDRPNLYDLFLMHAEVRGESAARDRADTVFSVHEGVTPFDTEKILERVPLLRMERQGGMNLIIEPYLAQKDCWPKSGPVHPGSVRR